MKSSIHSYVFLTGNEEYSPVVILDRNDDTRALLRLWAIFHHLEIKKNQILYKKIRMRGTHV